MQVAAGRVERLSRGCADICGLPEGIEIGAQEDDLPASRAAPPILRNDDSGSLSERVSKE
jgi:hypothetical protein